MLISKNSAEPMPPEGRQDEERESSDRRAAVLIETIKEHARALSREVGDCEISHTVLDAVGRVARDKFVGRHEQALAFADTALPIGHGQTISQPFIVAFMTELLNVRKGDRVLEIGTGSGYQAAVLAELGLVVYSVETIPELAHSARRRLHKLGYRNVHVRIGDGHRGWAEHAPYGAIVVTAVADRIPRDLLAQLESGGRLVIPLREPGGQQWLTLVEKDAEGHVHQKELFPVRFVPLRHRTGTGEQH